MKALIISDTHGHSEKLEMILKKIGKIDVLIHAGDVEGQEEYLRELVDCPCYMVAGNCDWSTELKNELAFDIAGRRFFLTHGHRYNVSFGEEHLVEEAKKIDADVVIYGHTHRPVVKEMDGVAVVNPGSLTYPRQMGRKPTFVILTMNLDGEMDFQICQVSRR